MHVRETSQSYKKNNTSVYLFCSFLGISENIFMKIERSVFNRRKRKLFDVIEMIRNKLAEELVPFENFMIVDSMPLEVCKLSKATRSKICSKIMRQLQIMGTVHRKSYIFMDINCMQCLH